MSDFTDDEDYEESSREVSSPIIEESSSQVSYEDSDDESYIGKESLKRNPNVKRHGSHRKKQVPIISDSDVSTDTECPTSGHDKKNLQQNISNSSSNRFSNVHDSNLISESSDNEDKSKDDIPENKRDRNKDLNGAKLSRGETSSTSRLPDQKFNTEEDVYKKIKSKTGKDMTESDDESSTDSKNVKCIVQDSGSDYIQSSDSEEIDQITEKLNSSRISNEVHFGEKGTIINSTLINIGNHLKTPEVSSKRSLNRSMNTPRTIKQMKESTTPYYTPPCSLAPNALQDSFLTPRNNTEILSSRSSSSDSSIEVLSDDDVIDVSSEERNSPVRIIPPVPTKRVIKQATLDSMLKTNSSSDQKPVKQEEEQKLLVSLKELEDQKQKVWQMEKDLLKAKNLLRTINMDNLPDKGKLIRDRNAAIEQTLKMEAHKLSKMVLRKEDVPESLKEKIKNSIVSWEELEAKAGAVLPKTFGKQAISTYNAQKAVTMDRLHQLHGSLESRPKEDTVAEDPKGLKVELMLHQKRALAWLMWREKQKPSGGILADDMGLGKTLTMIALMLKTMEIDNQHDDSDSENKSSSKYNGGTLIVCPASLINQWSGELERRTKRGLASCELYHGPKRETKAKKLAEYDMVVTTYSIVMNEYEKEGAVFRVNWRRIVTDEAHQIRNYKSQTSIAVCHLTAKSRWALTGTPVHNKELDMYALLKFLRCSPFDDLQVWRRWVGDKSTGGQERLHTVISSLMLRRTKVELMEKGSLNSMPERKWELIPVDLHKNEMDVYQRILIFSRTLFAQFLHQRAEKNQDMVDLKYASFPTPSGQMAPNQEYFKMRQKLLRLNKVKDIKQHEILVLLLRLRQICCHPSLITGMLHEDMENLDEEGEPEELNILDQLNKLALDDDDEHNPNLSDPALGLANENDATGLREATKGFLNPSHPVFSTERISSKIKVMLDVLKEKVLTKDDKAIIVSQWPSFLRLIAFHLKQQNISFEQLDGTVPVNKRMVMVDRFNDPNDKMKILLLSLTAGGVGLNLVGANHLFLLDLHWNPQLENQAQDRIYRVGQQKPVFVYKFMATDTIEKRILDLQAKKLDIANSMLTGTKQVIGSKLSLQDLKMLFDM